MRRARGFIDEEAGDRPFMDNTTVVEGVAAALAGVKAELEKLGHTIEVINFDRLTHETGIAEATVRKLFAGESVSPEEVDPPFKERLRFLIETRLHPDGRQYTRAELAAAAGCNKSTITHLLNGSRNPGFETSNRLANHFEAPGFFSIGPEKALLAALEPVLVQARFIAKLKGEQVEHVALRGSLADRSPQLAEQLQAAIQQVVDSARASNAPAGPAGEDDDPELSELTAELRSLPPTRRRGVMSIIKSAVGLASRDE
ncbi:helix-turn-helix transcriptional regulator [Streptomyces sp. NPDC001668]|uniref:helix-turn-helix transcriptional regulator n=1 Tax=Streptomyces sp. NPDC001668 TaxID=3364598 RepID=UPI0036B47417